MNRTVPNFTALSECGRQPLSTIYMTRCIKYWAKLTAMPSHRYPKQTYNMLRSLDLAGRTTWATHIKCLLFKFGFGYAWLANEVGDVVAFTKLFNTRVADCALQNLNEKVNTSSKTLYYKHFKTLLDTERYLSIDLPFLYKKSLSNFRCSGHCLNVETGRHQHIEREFRFCAHCLKSNVYTVEDELHMLLVCPLYCDLRLEFFPQCLLNRPICTQLFYSIMSTADDKHIYRLSKFIYRAFLLRQTL